MKVCGRDVLYTFHSKDNRPSLHVESGEVFCVKTQLNTGKWLQSADDSWHPDKNSGTNFTNCIEILGAKTGDVLAVEILDIQVEEIGYTGFAAWMNPVCQRIIENNWDVVYKVVKIENDEIHWMDGLRLPVRPMIGTIGVAPVGQPVFNGEAGRHGGNMDLQEVRKGSMIYLNVQTDGALLHVGDVHAIMGDGEINRAGGIECRSTVALRAQVLPGDEGLQWIRLQDETHIMAAACDENMEEAFYLAAGELIRYMAGTYGMDSKDAYLLLGQVMQGRCTAVVNKQKPYICKIDKAYLPKKLNEK